MSEVIRVVIADDHPILRQGIRQILEFETDIEVVGEAGNGNEAVAMACDLKPDLVLMDINMPDKTGVEAARELKAVKPEIRILILTIHDDTEYLREAASAGVEGYVLKDVAAGELVRAVRLASAGQLYLHPEVGGRLMRDVMSGVKREVQKEQELTQREREVLELVGKGCTNRQVAEALFISEKTVKNHLSHVFEKLGAADRLQAVLIGVRRGMIEIDKQE